MEYKLGNNYQIIGKVDAINRGINFYNVTVFNLENKTINIKLREEDEVIMGQIYEFSVICEIKNEKSDDIILTNLSHVEVESKYGVSEITKFYNVFYQYAPVDAKTLRQEIEAYLKQIKNKVLLDIVKTFYEDYKNKFYLHPAATKFHHTYIGGLAYHTLTMLKMAEAMLKIYPFLSKDLLYAGIIVHDIGKIDEMTGVDGEYTTSGLLIGHIVEGASQVSLIAEKLGYENEEEVLLLKHMIVSHHGQFNFGSPKRPQIAEALMLWYLDTIDSKFQVLGEVLEETVDNTFTTNIPVADKTRFLKHKLTKK